MIKTFERFKIPTLAGLGIILAGIVAGVVLILSEQTFLTEASPNFTPKNITVSNIDFMANWRRHIFCSILLVDTASANGRGR